MVTGKELDTLVNTALQNAPEEASKLFHAFERKTHQATYFVMSSHVPPLLLF